ncbi:hypothetical protein BDC45DRAFT_525485 [Circinella umbellata]|nr:hypothetical protein BDC45DRAFT_525485 [Circinella umbellata]
MSQMSQTSQTSQEFPIGIKYQFPQIITLSLILDNNNKCPNNLVFLYLLGLSAKFCLMTCPKGSVCRLQILGPLLFPDSQANFVVRLTAIITLVWRMKKYLTETLDKVNDEGLFIPTMANPTRKLPIDSSFHQENYGASIKKRKRSVCETSDNNTNNNSNNVSSTSSSSNT